MDLKKIDALNIGLIFISLFVAVLVPFKLFLFSYAVLGPLHYLTEINWLRQKNYFIKSKNRWYLVLLILAILISIKPISKLIDLGLNGSLDPLIDYVGGVNKILIIFGFLFSTALVIFNKPIHLVASLIVGIFISIILSSYLLEPFLVVALFLPTIIHVFLFTFFFMLYGAIKSNNKFGIFGAILLLFIPVGIFFLDINPAGYALSQNTVESFISSNILRVNIVIASIFGGFAKKSDAVLTVLGIKIQIFIAFAYTYHYLNWFSKTSVIGWKKALTGRKTILIGFIWLFFVTIYAYDYKTGFIALFFLSFLHVFLEFPLNISTIKGLALQLIPIRK